MVDDSGNLDAQPLSELAILYAEVPNCLLLLNLLEEHSQTVSLHNITPEPKHSVSKMEAVKGLMILTAPCTRRAQQHASGQFRRTSSAPQCAVDLPSFFAQYRRHLRPSA